MEETKTARKYKDSVFTKLFGEKENLLELYNAIGNTSYGKDTDIEITTLDNVLFMERCNDISFIINGKIVVLIEHQSTVNYNIPLRFLIYVSKNYEKITKGKDIYRKSIIPIPKPEFIVLYNGEEEIPDQQTLRLSDMYIGSHDELPDLELKVNIININKGRNKEIAGRSELLSGYENFVYLVREHGKTMDRDSAIKNAIHDCMKQNVLKQFLEKNSSEICNMIFTEWNWDDALAVSKEEGIIIGEAKGIAIGKAEKEEEYRSQIKSLQSQGLSPAEILERFMERE